MPEVDREARTWQLYIQDMIDFGDKALSYTVGLDQERFIAETLVYDATLRNLEPVGEAATHIPSKVRNAHRDRPALLPKLRNLLSTTKEEAE